MESQERMKQAAVGRWTGQAGQLVITALNPGESGGMVPMKQE